MTGETLAAAAQLCRSLELLPRGGRVLCAVSGGADSVCLLHWLNRMRHEFDFRLTAAHYNHQLRGEESLRDGEFVRSFVDTCCPEVELVLGGGDVAARAAQDGTGIEETARIMRYDFLQQTARRVGADVIATAHNAQDNAETMLLHLIRGSGLRGLTGIPPRRDNIVRPLLTTRRDEIEDYLRRYGLPHVEDSSNSDLRFTRNRVRHQLLPVLESMQPRMTRLMGKTAQLLSRDEDYLLQQARQALPVPEHIPGGLSVSAAALAGQHPALAVRMARLLLDGLNGDGGKCTAAQLEGLVGLCRCAQPSARLSLPGGILARRVYDRLELIRLPEGEEFTSAALPLPGELTLPWGTITARREIYGEFLQTPCSFGLSCVKVGAELTVRPRRTGDTLARPGRTGRRLKKILIDEKVPRHLRDALPVLDCGGAVAAVAGLGPDADFVPEEGEACWHICCTPARTEKGCLCDDGT